MLKNSYDVAMIMQRRKIYDGLSIYVPALGIEGKYSEDEGIFYALDGTSYEVLDEFIYDFDDDVSLICDFVLSKKDFNDKYKNQKKKIKFLMEAKKPEKWNSLLMENTYMQIIVSGRLKPQEVTRHMTENVSYIQQMASL